MSNFQESVFINCPFDSSYHVLLQSMLFTIIALGFQPRIASESGDAGVARLEKIVKMIGESKYSIHDLSRIKSTKVGEYYRLNMPFELGIDFGCRGFSSDIDHLEKKFLILGGKEFEYIKALSDLSGIDIKYHNNRPIELVTSVRDWFVSSANIKNPMSPNDIWLEWNDFCYYYTILMRKRKYSATDMYNIPVKEKIDIIKDFFARNNGKSTIS